MGAGEADALHIQFWAEALKGCTDDQEVKWLAKTIKILNDALQAR